VRSPTTYAFSSSLADHDHSALSVYSIKKGMQTYARQGGTSTIFVHDNILHPISAEDREERPQHQTGCSTSS